ncbi:hypothetical protein ACPOL_1819 [Acidisarcina polymorpha]|uniref:Uncharacterized protein n=1 Tax=Acidisarcina polymorpha TaxID=2211140 RepID=A0A2Z5FWF1_9BACT|nr:hypothetical protein ACPOL_1819 [Acidisarcina polymorpha]
MAWLFSVPSDQQSGRYRARLQDSIDAPAPLAKDFCGCYS